MAKEEPVKFIEGILTPQNPKDAYYINIEELMRYYFGLILIGSMMVFYMIIA